MATYSFVKVIMKRVRLILILIFVILSQFTFITMHPADAAASILYANPQAIGSGDCSTWDNACSLQTALANAISGDQIWVKKGRNIPTNNGDRDISFHLKSGVSLYGGFDGTESSLDQRDWVSNVTILSGDLQGNDDGFVNNYENSYHVVKGSTDAILDGFTIVGGNANGPTPDDRGGGIYNEHASPIINNAIICGNFADGGAGMNNWGSSPVITNVTFIGNKVTYLGAGMWIHDGGSPVLDRVTFQNNIATTYGGGIENAGDNLIITNSTFSDNTARVGGGMENYYNYNAPQLVNVTFTGNIAQSGGGIFNEHSGPMMINLTITNNDADYGGGIYNNNYSVPTIINSIIWGNGGEEILNDYGSDIHISYSDIKGGSVGIGNIDSNPLLAPLGNYGGSVKTMGVLPGSPVIDAAVDDCPETDARYFQRSNLECDMGAFESHGFSLVVYSGDYQSGPIKSLFPNPLCVEVIPNEKDDPVDGAYVSFNPPHQGPSILLLENPVIVDGRLGCSTARANTIIGGPYQVFASIDGLNDVLFSLTNIDPYRNYIALIER